MTGNLPRCIRHLTLLLALIFALPAQAQRVVEEIVVTATKREVSVQDVPIAVSAFSAEQLQRAGVQDIRDLQQLSPSLVLTSTQSETAGTTARLRGVGTTGDNLGLESSVAVFVDGVYRNRNSVALTDLGPVERVEVLRGPQGTLFGKNASAGLIQIITKQPDLEEFGGMVEAGVGSDDEYRVSGSFTGPIVEGKTGFRLDGTWTERDGFIDANDTTGPGGNREFNDRDRWLVRGQLFSEIGDALDLRLIGDYSTRDETCCAAVTSQAGPTAAIINGLTPLIPPPGIGTVKLPPDPFDRDMTANADRGYDSEVDEWGLSLEANWDVGPGTVTSISAYRDWDSDRSQDIDYTDADILYRENGNYSNKFKTLTQELRYAWSMGDFDLLVGGYYVDEDLDVLDGIRVGADYETYANAVIAGAGETVLLPPGSLAEGQGAITDDFSQNTESWALFTHNKWQASNEIAFTLGLRYTNEEKDLNATLIADNPACEALIPELLAGNINPVANGTLLRFGCLTVISPLVDSPNNPFAGPVPPYKGDRSDSEWTGTFIAEYQFNDDWMGYASYARGYKAGGYNLDRAGLSVTLLPGPPFFTLPTVKQLEFDPETVDSWEAGVKGSFLNEQVRLDLAVFSADYDDFQLNTFNGTNFTVSNIGEVNSIGFEAEGAAVVTDQLTLTGGIAYTDAKYASDLFDPTDPTVAQIAGEQLTNAPEWILTTAADFEQPITSSLLLSIHLDMRFVDDHNTGSDLDPAKKQNSYYLWNGNVGIGADDGFWEVELWAKNLFNKDYKQVVIDAPLQGTDPSNQTYAAFLGDPRTWGVRARVNF